MTANHPEVHDSELYECEIIENEDAPECKLTRISAGEAGTEAEKAGARAFFVPAVSTEGAVVYFTAFSVLAPGATDYEPSWGETSRVNLYRYDTETGRVGYVTTVSGKDFSDESECGTYIAVEPGATRLRRRVR